MSERKLEEIYKDLYASAHLRHGFREEFSKLELELAEHSALSPAARDAHRHLGLKYAS